VILSRKPGPATLLGGGALALIAVVAWVFTVLGGMEHGAGGMLGDMAGAEFPAAGMGAAATGTTATESTGMALSPSFAGAVAFLAGWAVMMTAMMLPSAMPMILLYGSLAGRGGGRRMGVPVVLFAGLYLIAWLAFGAPIYLANTLVGAVAASRPEVGAMLPYALAALLAAAGAFQLSPLKYRCLRVCRDPLGFLSLRFRRGLLGGLRLGLEHAGYCIGCCWALMVVLVAAGAMSLPWVLLISAVVYAEKLLPGSSLVAPAVGSGLILLGLLVALRPGLAGVL
jgi:predicted metal-binding membrane protein